VRHWLCLALLLLPTLSPAAVHRVPSEYANIQAGINAAAEGDTVLVAPGTYRGSGNRDLNFYGTNLVLISESGRESTVIDAQGHSGGMVFSYGETQASRVSGFTFRNGASWGSGGIHCDTASPVLEDLIIEDCISWGWGGGIYLQQSDALLQDLILRNNTGGTADSWSGAGGGLAAYQSSPTVRRVRFEGNLAMAGNPIGEGSPRATGGGASFNESFAVLEDVQFIGNRTEVVTSGKGSNPGGGLYANRHLTVRRGTFVGNSADIRGSGSAAFIEGGTLFLEQCIVAFNGLEDVAPAIPVVGRVQASCCLVFGNEPADWTGGIADQQDENGNLAVDPQFCGAPGSGNQYLQADSPCLPENNDCGLIIGALDQGCELTPVFLAGFTTSPRPGAVDLSWRLGVAEPSAEFELRAERDGAQWTVPWRHAETNLYTAHDAGAALASGGTVTYRLRGGLPGESAQLLRTQTVEVPPAGGTRLLEPHPNPFNPTTELGFALAEPLAVSLAIYDLSGRRVAMLLDDVEHGVGEHVVTWDGRGEAGSPLPSGVYFARMSAGSWREEARLVLLK